MADKKVERNVRASDQERPSTPTQKMVGALSDTGTVNMAGAGKDKGKASLFDRFRDREERYRRAQSLGDVASGSTAARSASGTPAEDETPGKDAPEGEPPV
jgi:hypothetical protein